MDTDTRHCPEWGTGKAIFLRRTVAKPQRNLESKGKLRARPGAFTHKWRAFLTVRFLKNMDFERIPQVVCRDRLDTDRFALEERVVAFVARRRKAIVQRLELAPRRLETTRSSSDGTDQVGKMCRGRAE